MLCWSSTLGRREYSTPCQLALHDYMAEELINSVQIHHLLSVREGSNLPPLPWRARSPPLPYWRGALHRLQVVRGHLPGSGHHDRS